MQGSLGIWNRSMRNKAEVIMLTLQQSLQFFYLLQAKCTIYDITDWHIGHLLINPLLYLGLCASNTWLCWHGNPVFYFLDWFWVFPFHHVRHHVVPYIPHFPILHLSDPATVAMTPKRMISAAFPWYSNAVYEEDFSEAIDHDKDFLIHKLIHIRKKGISLNFLEIP